METIVEDILLKNFLVDSSFIPPVEGSYLDMHFCKNNKYVVCNLIFLHGRKLMHSTKIDCLQLLNKERNV